MKYKIEYLNDKLPLEGEAGSFLEFVEMNKDKLSGGLLTGADLRDAILYCADLTGADLTGANLTGADLTDADLRDADLTDADLRGADLTGADLTGADLTCANLTGAKIDFSTWPLWCGTQNVKVDKKIAAQIATHFCWLDCDDEEVKAAQEAVKPLARQCKHWLKRGEG